MKKIGKQTYVMANDVFIRDAYTIAGTKEGEGPLGDNIDYIMSDSTWGEKTWEKCEAKMQQYSVENLISKNNLKKSDIDLMLAGDLLNQIVSSSFAARSLEIPFIGLYGACSTMALSMGVGALLIDGGFAENVVCVTSSHFCCAERQYRIPLESGGQRHMCAQWTVTGSGAVWLSKNNDNKDLPKIKNVTFGKIIDLGVTDSNNMGAAMAPAAADTIRQNIIDTNVNIDYDLIVSGDLGTVGKSIANKLLQDEGINIEKKYDDCGTIIYDIDKQDAHAGASGCGCSAVVFGSFLYKKLLKKEINTLLFTATGALHSPTVSLQGESVPGIAHSIGISN
ncbi:stage V sporulation protein AD [Sedimentibacter sp. zth1]|uniref:stage V sporulation protein AD n=1 Tax=Sedimentibacter sp. zth1 TaxID=2816908 RepID=UPI001A91C0A2|nr:stage V sporulation protein AD [Sedimentibacter sp. zth1]QSX06389.1 stage V sporulation protein AD [Sedimentibacter sp. zth1]